MTALAVDNMSIKYFDTLEYVQRLEAFNVPREQASFQAKQLESALETAVQYVKHDIHEEIDNKELATKGDILELKMEFKGDIASLRGELKGDIASLHGELKGDIAFLRSELKGDIISLDSKIKDLRYDTLKFTVWTGVGVIFAVAGMMAKGFHWFGIS